MKILVTGGTGVVGTSTVTELLRRDHSIVLLARHAGADVDQWPKGITPRPGDIADAGSIRGAADGCDVVLHMAAIVEEGDGATFDAVNVGGTANILAEAERAKVPRFIYVSSLGANIGESAYHKSKARGEELVHQFSGRWTIVRPGNVYGPGDGQISLLLRLVRGPSPIVPRVGSGDQPLQPIWWEDCARAMATVVERDDLDGRGLDLAGGEVTSQNDLIRRLGEITGRETRAVSVPDFLVTLGARAISSIGWEMSFNDDQVTMLHEGNVIANGGVNALTTVLGIDPTLLDVGLRRLCDLQPEQLPSDGVGTLKRKRYWADIVGTSLDAAAMFDVFRRNFGEVTPVQMGGDESAPAHRIEEGETITLALPMRGHVQVRAADVGERQLSLLTLEGHPLAGVVRFQCNDHGPAVRFQVEVYSRAANLIDLFAMRTLGDRLQDQTWKQVVEQMIERSGGSAIDGPCNETVSLDDDQARAIEEWIKDIVTRVKRGENEAKIEAKIEARIEAKVEPTTPTA